MARKYTFHRRPQEDLLDGGQDSFLDIVSNIVGILIILVMIAGAGVRAVGNHNKTTLNESLPEKSLTEPLAQQEETVLPPLVTAESEKSFADRYQEEQEFLKLSGEMERIQTDVISLRQETTEMDGQLALVRRQAEMAEREHQELLIQTSQIQGALDAAARKQSEKDQTAFRQKQELARIKEQLTSLDLTRKSLAAAIKADVHKIENIPTPLTKKVEGHEAFFRLKNNKISHVPMNVFIERLRGTFRGFHDLKKTKIDETIGPVEDYSFHYEATMRQVRDGERIAMSIFFDYGECIPQRENIGEDYQSAIASGSRFQQKLGLYLGDSSTITLFVYPDSFELLRDIKKFLIDRGYTIALRPMPMNQNITVSPYGTASQAY